MVNYFLIVANLSLWLFTSLSTLAVEPSATWTQSKLDKVSQISIAAEDGWPPFADQFGKGISHQIIAAVFEQQHVKVRSVIVSYSRALMMAENGDVDAVFNISRLKQTEDKYLFGNTPLFTTHSVFYHNVDRPLPATTNKEFKNKTKVGLIKGFEYDGEIEQLVNAELIYVDNQYQLINLLLVNRIDTALMYEKVADNYISEMRVTRQIQKAFTHHYAEIYLGFSKARPYAQYFADLFDEGLAKLQQQARYQDIIAGFAAAPSSTKHEFYDSNSIAIKGISR